MLSIEEYIEMSKTMPNTSDGGSAAYHFDNVVLVKYTNLIKYASSGKARDDAENIMEKANALNAKGVNTPKHLAIKRGVEGDSYVCYVLQERAPGVCFKYYTHPAEKAQKIKLQTRIATAPDSHYEKLVKDVAALLHLGIELKPKNLFYNDNAENGGWTIIDLLREYGKPFNPNNICDIVRLYSYVNSVFVPLRISNYDKEATDAEREISAALEAQTKLRIFKAMEKAIPNFKQHRRWLLRTLPSEEVKYLQASGIEVGDLTLTKDEEKLFEKRIEQLANDCIKSLETGESKYWQVGCNLITNGSVAYTLQAAWVHHKANKNIGKRDEYESDYDFIRASQYELSERVAVLVDKKLAELAKTSQNPNIIAAAQDMEQEIVKAKKLKK